MFYPLSAYIGLRYIYTKKGDKFGRFVFWLSMIGIMLGTIGLIVVLSIMNGLEDKIQNGTIHFLPQVQITDHHHRLHVTQYPRKQFTHLSGVTNITPLVTGEIIVQSLDHLTVTSMMGVYPNEYEPIKQKVFQGDFSSLEAGKYNIIIGYGLANKLNVSIGDKIRLISTGASQVTPVGRIPTQRLFTVSGLFNVNQDIDSSVIYLNIEDAARLMNYPQNTITSWRLFLPNPLNFQSVIEQSLSENLQFSDWRQYKGELFQTVKMEKNIMTLLISLIVIVAAFNIITSLSLLVMEKRSEVAILKTQGLTPSKIMTIFMIQGASSGMIGALLGTIIGLFIAANPAIFNLLMVNIIVFPSLIDLRQVMWLLFFLLLLTLFTPLYPAYYAAKIQPAETLRYE